jgi:hypothetical protein
LYTDKDQSLQGRKWLLIWFALAAVLALDAWTNRFFIYSDGISYLEIGRAYSHGDWAGALNSYWSPMYSWLIALMFLIFRPSPEWELPVFHIVNLLGLLAAMPCFEFLLRRVADAFPSSNKSAFRFAGYAVFAWCVLDVVPAGEFRPDPLLLAPVFLVLGLMLVPRNKFFSYHAVIIGISLGFAYFVKTASLFPALIVLGMLLLMRGVRKSMIAALALACLIGPFICALSISKGRLTVGDSGRLNYGWEVNGLERSTHWQGGLHPTRQILTSPRVFEFATPVPGSYPPWRDPSYWYEGLRTNFNLAAQLRTIYANGKTVLWLMVSCPVMVLAACAAIRRRKGLAAGWPMLLPSLSAIALYTMVFVDKRYLAPWLIGIALPLIAVASIGSSIWLTILKGSAIVSLAFFLEPIGFNAMKLAAELETGFRSNPYCHLVSELQSLGVRPGDPVGYVGMSIDSYWASLLPVRIVTEVPVSYMRSSDGKFSIGLKDVQTFWGDANKRSEAIVAMKRAGAKVIVADSIPDSSDTMDWLRLGSEHFTVCGNGLYLFKPSSGQIH